MRKKLLSLAIAAIAAMGFIASAQQQAPQNKMYTPKNFTEYAFEGVLLDVPQQQRIDSLHNALRTPCQRNIEAGKACPDSAKACDRLAPKPKDHPKRPRGNRMGMMSGVEYVAKVKEILTPDQFDIFMSNIQTMPDDAVNNLMPAPQKRFDGKKACKDGDRKCKQKAECKGQKCDDKKCDKDKCNKDKCDKSQKCDKVKCDKSQKCDKDKCPKKDLTDKKDRNKDKK